MGDTIAESPLAAGSALNGQLYNKMDEQVLLLPRNNKTTIALILPGCHLTIFHIYICWR
jgi:hypothetical protein